MYVCLVPMLERGCHVQAAFIIAFFQASLSMSAENTTPELPSAAPSDFTIRSEFSVGTPGADEFVDRRSNNGSSHNRSERRQFGSSHTGLSEDGRELALAIDRYKVEHHRRYLTCDEMLIVLRALGYSKSN